MADVEVRDILLRCGGRTLQRTGFLCALGSGRGYVEVKETFTRADPSTCATFIDRDVGSGQVLRLAEAGKVRIEYPPALSGLVDAFGYPYCGPSPEGSRTNSCLQSETFGTTWVPTRSSVSSNADTAPDGTVTADRLIEDATAGATHPIIQGVTITANENCAVSVHAKAGTRTWLALQFERLANGAINAQRYFNLATGALGTASGNGGATLIGSGIVPLGNGWYRCYVTGNIGGGFTDGAMRVGLATGDGVSAYNGDGASYVSLWGGQFERAAFPSSYVKTVGSLVTRAADALTVPLTIALQALTIHADFIHPSSDAGVRGVFHLGAAGVVGRLFDLNWSGTKYRVTHGDAATGYVEASAVATPSPGDRVRIAACLYPDGHVSIEQAINSGAVAAAVSNATPKALAAITQQVLVGRRDVGLEQYGVIFDSKLIRNVRTLAECEVAP